MSHLPSAFVSEGLRSPVDPVLCLLVLWDELGTTGSLKWQRVIIPKETQHGQWRLSGLPLLNQGAPQYQLVSGNLSYSSKDLIRIVSLPCPQTKPQNLVDFSGRGFAISGKQD